MILARLRAFFLGSLRRQLIFGVALFNAVIMALFVDDLTHRQQALLQDQQVAAAKALVQGIATSSAGWLAARDLHGLQEIVETQRQYPELAFAMILDRRGRVLAHSDPGRLGSYVQDLPKRPESTLLSRTTALVDVAIPVVLAGRQLGWARIGLHQEVTQARLADIHRDGLLYALGAIIVGVLMAALLAMGMTRRLQAIREAADAVQGGYAERRAHLGGTDEAAHLGQAFNAMLDTLAEREAALRASENKLATILDNVSAYIYLKDTEGRYLYANRLVRELFHAQLDEVVGQDDGRFFDPETFRQLQANDQRVLRDGETIRLEENNVDLRSGHLATYWTVKLPLRRENGDIYALCGISTDITERKQTELLLAHHKEELEEEVRVRTADLEQAKVAAESASRAKSIFLANMSHELRTPLNAILGFAQLMARDSRLPEDERDNLGIINKSGQHLLNLINDVLEISKIEAGRITVTDQLLDLHELLASLVESMALRARDKGLSLQLEQADDLPCYIHCDLGKLRQILLNLLSNAVKYTLEGSITLQARVREAGASPILELVVTDTGPGIAREEQRRIFEAFYQTEAGIQLGEGTGLGLTISRQYAELLGGSLSLESQPGRGSCFTLLLPVALSEAMDSDRALQRRIVGLAQGQPDWRILVAEDQPDNQRLMEVLLKGVGFQVRVVGDGAEAVTAVAQWRPHFVWMDMRMPQMDGFEATRRIRAMAKAQDQGEHLPIVALTASAFEEDRAAILAAGCDDVMKKPIEADRLLEMLARHLDIVFEYEVPAQGPMSPGSSSISLAGLPVEQVRALRAAAEILDTEALQNAIAQIRDLDAGVADHLDRLATNYSYDRIQKLCASGDTEG